jgi:REP element-mobilizing transposase RayT
MNHLEGRVHALLHRIPPQNLPLLQLIRAKREGHWKASLQELRSGFRGWHQRGYLPHFDAPGITQMVTFTLADAFPIRRSPEWEWVLRGAEDSEQRQRIERWLDRGFGECWLRFPAVAESVERVILENNTIHFQLKAWVIMPNHLHLVVDVWDVPLAKLIGLWKGRSSRLANELLTRQGPFWHEDYFDTLVRDQDHLTRAIRYTEQNPSKARISANAKLWLWSSARRRDLFGRLPWEGED